MVTPYLSRLRPAESGPRLRPRPRSRFEPAPALPIDGPAIAIPGLSLPAPLDPGPAGAEIEFERAAPHPSLAGSAVLAAAPGEQEVLPARAAAPGPAPRDAEGEPPRTRRAAVPPHGPSPDITPSGQSPRPVPVSSEEDVRPPPAEGAGRGEHTQAPWSIRPRSAPQPQSAPPDQAPVSGDRAGRDGRPGAQPAPAVSLPAPERPLPAPRRHLDRTGQEAQALQKPAGRPGDAALPGQRPDDAVVRAMRRPEPPGDAPAERVQAMAGRLREADAAAARTGAAARPPAGPQLAPAPPARVPGRPGQAEVHTEITVTIGRIEVKTPAAVPMSGRPQSSGSRRRPPSLDDYLEARTRARSSPG
jgi:hypothetical protein